jgi:hypothetical protein
MPSSTSISNKQADTANQKIRTLFLAWQNPDQRDWHTVGRLDQEDDTYVFRYTQGAEQAQKHGFDPIVSFPDLQRTYESDEIFPLFANQVLSRNRPEFDDFVEWLSIPKDEADPIAILARTGDQARDTLEIFPYPQKRDEHTYTLHFFVRGLRHQSSCAIERATKLESGDPLLLTPDVQNEHDPNACLLRTAERKEQDMHLMGYLPRYLAREFSRLPKKEMRSSTVEVVRINPSPAPIHFRILCRLKMNWTSEGMPFDETVYQPLNED